MNDSSIELWLKEMLHEKKYSFQVNKKKSQHFNFRVMTDWL